MTPARLKRASSRDLKPLISGPSLLLKRCLITLDHLLGRIFFFGEHRKSYRKLIFPQSVQEKLQSTFPFSFARSLEGLQFDSYLTSGNWRRPSAAVGRSFSSVRPPPLQYTFDFVSITRGCCAVISAAGRRKIVE